VILFDYSLDLLHMMWNAITVIEAQEQLKAMTVADWPNMKQSQRTKLHKDLHDQAYPNNLQKKNFISIDELQKVLGR
jgi:hypothetical protein